MHPLRPARHAGLHAPVVAIALVLLTTACSPKDDAARSAIADTLPVAAAPPDTMPAGAGHDMVGMAMTGDADRDFLRMMGDHHKGLIAMAHESMEDQRGTAQSRADARKLDTKQDAEVEQMGKMLQMNYQDSYEPKVMPADQTVVDALLKQPGAMYASEFYRNVVAHHRKAITMIDEYLVKAMRPDVKAMAEQMRKDQLAEIQELERKAGT